MFSARDSHNRCSSLDGLQRRVNIDADPGNLRRFGTEVIRAVA